MSEYMFGALLFNIIVLVEFFLVRMNKTSRSLVGIVHPFVTCVLHHKQH